MSSEPDLSVVIPAYNEEARLPRAIPAIAGHLERSGRTFEIIVVDDGSRDRTAAVADELARQFPILQVISLKPNRGKGAAVKAGMLAARGRYALFTDADQSTPIGEVDRVLERLEREGFDLAIGSRTMPGAQVTQPQAWYRQLAGKLFGLGTRCLVLRGIRDTQCGFKCLRQDVAARVFPQVTSVTAIFDIELLAVATREGYRIAEVPVRWVHDPDTRIPYNLRQSLRIWGELFRIRRAQQIGWPLKARKT